MLGRLKGTLAERGPGEVLVDVGGVGYRVFVSVVASAQLPAVGAPVELRIRTVVREDAFDLYGFPSRLEEALFLQLTSVSQVGPRLALTVLSGLEPAALVEALARGEVTRLTRIHGVGKKTAERLVLELKDKVKLLPLEELPRPVTGAQAPVAAPLESDLTSALVNLGYREKEAAEAARQVAQEAPEAGFEAGIREALKRLRSGR